METINNHQAILAVILLCTWKNINCNHTQAQRRIKLNT